MNGLTWTLSILAVVSTGVMAGLYFTFSVAIMRALAELPPAQGVAAMNLVNERIVNPLFLLFFLGSALACLGLVVVSFIGDGPGRWLRVAGAVLFLVGAFGVTIVVHLPLNDALAAVDPADPGVAGIWQKYLTDWMPPQHLRTVAAIVGMTLILLGLPPGTSDQGVSPQVARVACAC